MTAAQDQPAAVVAPPRDFRLIDSTLRDGSHAICALVVAETAAATSSSSSTALKP